MFTLLYLPKLAEQTVFFLVFFFLEPPLGLVFHEHIWKIQLNGRQQALANGSKKASAIQNS